MISGANSFTNHNVGKTGDTADISAINMIGFNSIQSVESKELSNFKAFDLAIKTDAGNGSA